MNTGLPNHRGAILQKGRGIGSGFSSLFRTLLPIGKQLLNLLLKQLRVLLRVLLEEN